jgi:hypothetical protein
LGVWITGMQPIPTPATIPYTVAMML